MKLEHTLSLASVVLKSPSTLLEGADDPKKVAWLVPRLFGLILAGGAIFGLVIGSYRGGLQLPFAAMKTPLLFILPLLIASPAVAAISKAVDAKTSWARIGLAGLIGAARAAILAAAFGPVLWLLYSLGVGYHLAVILLAATVGGVGIAGLALLTQAAVGGRARILAGVSSLMIAGTVLAQTGWLLRPFVARPTAEVTLFRPVEENVGSALIYSAASSVEIYPGWASQPAVVHALEEGKSDASNGADQGMGEAVTPSRWSRGGER